jgi:hypothetical protein
MGKIMAIKQVENILKRDFKYLCIYRNIRTAIPETSGHETGCIRTLCRLV